MTFIDSLGFHRTRLDEYLANLQSGTKAIWGAGIDLSVETPEGQWLGIFAEAISDAAGVLEDIYNGRSPAGAIGAQLARLVRLNGLTKKGPAFSEAPVTLGGVAGTVIPAGSLVGSTADATLRFATAADYTLDGGGSATGQVIASVAGPISAAAHTLTIPMTIIAGWNTVDNASDSSIGNTGETDAQLRARRASSVALPAQGMKDALLAAILNTAGVVGAVVRENPTDSDGPAVPSDGGSLAAHAIQAIVDGGLDTDIANALWLKRFPGCTMVGATSVDVTDSQGNVQTVSFDRPDDTDIFVEIHTATALSGPEQSTVQGAIVARGQGTLSILGEPLPGSKIAEKVSVSDVYDAITYLKLTSMPTLKVGKIFIGTSASPTLEDDIAVLYNAIARWDSGRITFASP